MKPESIRILLVEDNLGDIRLLKEALGETKFVQFELTPVESLNEAFEQIDKKQFDVILLDLSLPDAWGYDTIMRMRDQVPDIPIVILTGTDDETLAVKTVQMGAQDYLVKGQADGNLIIRTLRYAIERGRLRKDLAQQMSAFLYSEARFHNMIEHNADSIIIVDREGLIRFVNPAAEALFCQPAEALLGQPFKFPLETNEVTEVEITCQSDPKASAVAEIRVVETVWDDTPAYLASLRDITERKRAEAELQKYREHLEYLVEERTKQLEKALVDVSAAHDKINTILHSVADGLVVTDLEHRVILANPAAGVLFGFREEETLGQEIGTNSNHTWLRDLVQSSLTHRINHCEIDVKLEDPSNGQLKILQAQTALVDDHRGELLGTVTIIRDVTRLREVDRLKTEFLTLAAHELRTPLTSILGFSEILLGRSLDNSRQQRFLGMINEQAIHLVEIVSNLLDIARLEAGRGLEIKLEPLEIGPLLKTALRPFCESASKHHFQLDLQNELPLIMGDNIRLRQVGKNLISNAIKYSPEGGKITISSQIIPGYMQISIQDEGIGLTPEQQTHLFEQFYRADTSHTAIGGTGLGLTISKLIINLHGGNMWVESQYGVGTTVYFTLPLVKDAVKL